MDILRREGYDCRYYHGYSAKIKQYIMQTKFLLDYATAAALFLDEYYLPAYAVKPRGDCMVVQLWHACGAFKKWGYSTEGLSWGPSKTLLRLFPMHNTYTHVCVSSPAVIEHYADAFRCKDSIIRPWGVPRTDVYFMQGFAENARQAILKKFPAIGRRKILLYAPTFRGDNLLDGRHDPALDLPQFRDALGRNCALLLRPHPRIGLALPEAAQDEGWQFAFDARSLPIETLLAAADLLITDYSSVIFEYALFSRPMIFFPYDLEDYMRCRAFYYNYASFVPGDLVWDTDDMIRAVQGNLLGDCFDPVRVQTFAARFMSACDGKSAERILHMLRLT
jgi:CDP-ribitol ribitolphosphotransferase